jgi:hypothetical protein
VTELASRIYQDAEGGHSERSGAARDIIEGALSDWEDELEEARNQRAHDEEEDDERQRRT